jgi:hypothetical protein
VEDASRADTSTSVVISGDVEVALHSAEGEQVYSRLPTILTFMAGIATGAFTNIFTGLQREQLGWRIAAMVAFLASGALLFASAIRGESALSRARLIAKGGDDVKAQFRHEFGKKGWAWVTLATLAGLAAVGLLMIATLLQSTAPRP